MAQRFENGITFLRALLTRCGQLLHGCFPTLEQQNGITFSRLSLTRYALVAALLLVGVNSVWGDTKTYTFASKSWTCSPTSDNWTKGKDGNGYSNSGIQVTTGTSGAYGTSPISFENISSITVNYCTNASNGVGTIKVYAVDNANVASGSGTQIGSTFNVSKPSSGGTTQKTATFTPTGTPTGYVRIVATCSTNSVYICSITITYTPTPVEPIYNYWYVNGEDYDVTETTIGTPTLPAEPEVDCDGRVFVGWTTKAYKDYEHATDKPAVLFKTAAEANAYTTTDEETFYAVFAKAAGGGTTTQTVSKTSFSETSGDIETGVISYASYKGGGTSAPATQTSGGIRLYQNSSGSTAGYIVISAAAGCKITSASITSTNAYSTTTGYYLSETDPTTNTPSKSNFTESSYSLGKSSTYTVSNLNTQHITFACFGTSSNNRLEIGAISVTYESGGGVTYSDYVTQCGGSTATPNAPTISPDGGTYHNPIDVTITPDGTGTSIFYTTDGTDPQNGTLSDQKVTISLPQERADYVNFTYTVRAFAVNSNTTPSEEAEAQTYFFQAAAPVLPASYTCAAGTQITITSDTEDAIIYYTTDGTAPADLESTQKYNGPITINSTTTIRAIASADSFQDSEEVTATYTIAQLYTLNTAVNNADWGSVSLSPSGAQAAGTPITATATAKSGYRFVSWNYSGTAANCTTNGNKATITLEASNDYTITATFEAIPTYTLKTAVVGSGSISLSKEGPQYAETEIIATANPTTGHRFVRWDYSGTAANCTTNGNKATITLEASNDYTITATFEAIPTYEVIWLNGSETHHSQSVTHGDNIGALPAAPTGKGDCAGKTFVGWTTAEVTNGNKPSVLFKDVTGGGIHLENITGAKTFYAVFADKGAVVGSITEFATGDYYLITLVEGTYYAMSGKLDGKEVAAIDITAAITNTDGVICVDSENAVITDNMKYNVSGTVSAASIKNIQNNAYIGWSSSDLVSNNTNKWAVTSLNGAFQFASSTGRCIMYRANYDFRSYQTTATYSSGYLYLVPAVEPDYSNYATECAECNEPTVTVTDGTCAVNSTLNLLNTCFTSTNNNEPTFSCEQEGQTIEGSNFKPTKVGEYTITVTQPIDKTTTPYTCGVSETFKVTVTCLEANAIVLNTATVDVAEATISWVKDASISRYEVTVVGVDAANIEVDQANGKATVTGLNENTTYNYTVTGIVDKDVYCDNVTATGSFKTNEIPSYEITWKNNGQDWSTGATTSVKHGSKIAALPTTKPTAAAGCHEKEFVGWISATDLAAALKTAGEEPFATAPAGLFTDIDGSPEITVATTFHAVFADVKSTTEPGEPVTSWTEYKGTITAGEYLITYDGSAMNSTLTSSRLQFTTVDLDAVTDDITWVIAASEDNWTLKNKSTGTYAFGTGVKNVIGLAAEGSQDTWTISGTDTYEFVSTKNTEKEVNKNLRKNTTFGFACYGTSTGGALTLYKKTTTTDDITKTTIENYVTTCSSGIPVTVVISPAEAETAGATAIAEHTDLTVNGQTTLKVTNVPRGWTFTEWTTSSQGASIENATEQEATLTVGSAPVEVSANFTTLPERSVTWKCNGVNYTTGSPTATVYSGEQVTELPDAPTVPSGCAFDKVFVGWTAREDYGEPNDVAPSDLFTTAEGSPVITADVTFHAVFAAPPYRKITSASELTDGTYLIVCDSKNIAYAGKLASNNYGTHTSVTIENNKIADKGSAVEVTITGTSSSFSIYDGTYYLKNSGTSMSWSNTASTGNNWKLAETLEINSLSNKEYFLQYNAASPRFSCYKGTQEETYLFKKSTTRGYITLCDNNDVVVNTGDTWTVASDVTIGDLVVEADAKVEVEAGATLDVASVTMKSEGDKVPHLVLPSTNSELITADKTVTFTKWITNDRYYIFALPYDCKVSDIGFSDGTTPVLGTDFLIKHYDGAARVENGGKKSSWVAVTASETLQAGKGYEVAVAYEEGKELVFPMKLAHGNMHEHDNATKSFGYTAHGITSSTDATYADDEGQCGWNLIGNPYFTHHAASGLGDWMLSIPEGSTYNQTLASAATLSPFSAFFIQAGKDGSLAFEKASSTALLAPRFAPAADAERPVYAGISLSNGVRKDETTLVIGDQFTQAYEIGADLEKMLGLADKPQVYIHDSKYQYAFKSLNETDAANANLLGVYLPAEGEYTFDVMEAYDLSRVQAIYLTDNVAAKTVNLLDAPYTFTNAAEHNTTRFALSVVRKPEATTDLGNVQTTWAVWQDVPLHVRMEGLAAGDRVRVIDATGKLVCERVTAGTSSEVNVPQSGVYCIEVVGQQGVEVKKMVIR